MSPLLAAPVRKRTLRAPTPTAIAAASDPDALISKAVVLALTGLSASTLRRKIKEGSFPKPSHLSPRLVRWRAGDVRAWLQANHADPLMPLA